MRPNADRDLPWYLGSGASSAFGGALASSLGAMLEHVGQGSLDVSRIEDRFLRTVGDGAEWNRIHDRLAQIDPHHVAVLVAHYGQPRLTAGLTAAALLVPMARRHAEDGHVTRGSVDRSLRAALRARDRAPLLELEAVAMAAVLAAVRAYEAVELPRSARYRKVETRGDR